MKYAIAILAGITLMLGGCASWYDPQVDNPATYHAPSRLDESYNVSGRFSITTPDKSYYGNFTWQHQQNYDNLALNSPLGSTVAEITVESGMVTLVTEHDQYHGSDVDQILTDNLGFSLPLDYLHYWVQGVPLPNYPVRQQLASGFSQLNWQIEYLRWQDSNHPQVVQISNPKLKIKLLINWPTTAD